MNFDWYGASVSAGPDEVLGEIVGAFDEAKISRTRGMHGYMQGAHVKRDETVLATIFWEGRGFGAGGCYVQGTGQHAAPVAKFLRSLDAPHRVSRADVAEDYTGAGTWDLVSRTLLSVADKHGVKVEHAGDHHRGVDGRSLYLGGRQAVTRAIGYEKGKQLGTDPDHVRIELRVRPQGEGKSLAAKALPEQLYGSSRWSRDLGDRMGRPDIARLSLGTIYREEDIARSRRALLKQYGATLRGLETECGNWGLVGVWLGQQLDGGEDDAQ
jgi:hypothetical protein